MSHGAQDTVNAELRTRQREALTGADGPAAPHRYPLFNQRLDLLQHLTQFSDRILVIRGEPGSGKTTLLDQLEKRLGQQARICRLQAGPGLEREHLLRALANALDLRERAGIEQIKARLSDMQHAGQVCHLLIDDAQQLPPTTLNAMMSLFYSNGGNALRIALFAEAGVIALLNGTGIASHLGERLQTMGMPALAREDCAAYLQHRLQTAGLDGPLPFSEEQIDILYQRSEGLPGRLNAEAADMLGKPGKNTGPAAAPPEHAPPGPQASTDGARQAPAGQKVARKTADRPWRLLKRGLAGLFTILIAGLLIMQDEINRALAPPPAATTRQAVTQAPKTGPATTGRDQPSLAGNEITRAASVATAPESQASQPETAATSPPAVTTPAVKAPPGSAPEAPAPKAGTADAPPARKTDPPHVEPAGRPVPEPEPMQAGLKDAAWLQAQDPAHYTLQLIASLDPQAVRDFARQHGIENESAIFRRLRQGRSWYALAHGIYPDKAAALAARDALPPALQRQSPWIRRLSSVQADIEKAGKP